MSIHSDMQGKIKEAMKAKDAVRLSVVRGLVAAFMNELVAKKRKPTELLTDDEALAVIQRSVKQRKDSIEQFSKGGRQDLVEGETAELKVLQEFMPAQMSRDEIKKMVIAKKSELGISDKKDVGKLMSAVMKELKGKEKIEMNLEKFSGDEKTVIGLILAEPAHIDKIIQTTKLKPHVVSAVLTGLELKGFIKNTGGQIYTLC